VRKSRHIPVLLDAVLGVIDPKPGQVVVDCTVGLGGHASALLRHVRPEGRLVGFDFDPANLDVARPRLEALGGRFDLVHTNFAALPGVLAGLGIARVAAVLADVGVASTQIDDPARGFSYRRPGPLDMRMDPARGQSAADLVNRMPQRELAAALLEYGDETDAPAIAELIVRRRAEAPIDGTLALAEIVRGAIPRGFSARHVAARTCARVPCPSTLVKLSSALCSRMSRSASASPSPLCRPAGLEE
jgi:16S rRNA (cytosine1402-N4)-methyltransferase